MKLNNNNSTNKYVSEVTQKYRYLIISISKAYNTSEMVSGMTFCLIGALERSDSYLIFLVIFLKIWENWKKTEISMQ